MLLEIIVLIHWLDFVAKKMNMFASQIIENWLAQGMRDMLKLLMLFIIIVLERLLGLLWSIYYM